MSNVDKMLQALHEGELEINEAEKQLTGRISFNFVVKINPTGDMLSGEKPTALAKVDSVNLNKPESRGSHSGIRSFPVVQAVLGPVFKKLRSTPNFAFKNYLEDGILTLTIAIKMQGKSQSSKPVKAFQYLAKQLGKAEEDITYSDLSNFIESEVKSSISENLSKNSVYVGKNDEGEYFGELNSNFRLKEPDTDSTVYGGSLGVTPAKYIGTVTLNPGSVRFTEDSGNEGLFEKYQKM